MAEVGNDGDAGKIHTASPAQRIEGIVGIDIDDGDSKLPVTPRDATRYIHDMSIELKGMAKSAKLSDLANLLDLVIQESAFQKRDRL